MKEKIKTSYAEFQVIYVDVLVQSLSHVQIFAIPWTAAFEAPLSSTTSRSLLQLMCTEWQYCTLKDESTAPLLRCEMY